MKLKLALFSSLVLLPHVANAQPVEGYTTGASGGIARDGFGGCVRTMMWRPELAVEGCDGYVPKPAPVATVKPTVAAAPTPTLAPAPAPAPAPVFTPVPAPAPLALAAPQPVVRKIDLRSDALFAVNSAELRRDAQASPVDELVAKLRSAKSLESISIVGHTDSTGAADYNQKLSERRAESVKAELVKNGIDPKVISTQGRGAREPLADNKTREGRAKNRRVAITVTGTQ